MRRLAVTVALLTTSSTWAHDVSVDTFGTMVAPSEANPRSGSVGTALSASYDFNDAWSAWLGATYTRDLATATETTASAGSNIFLVNAGALFVATDHWLLMASFNYSPKSAQYNALHLVLPEEFGTDPNGVDLIFLSETTSGGGTLMASWLSGGGFASTVTHTIDGLVSVNAYRTYQKIDNPLAGAAGTVVREFCAEPENAGADYCPLINGVRDTLVQARLGLTYTATIKRRFDLGLDGSVFVYSANPNDVGFYGVLALGRSADMGSGVPVVPVRASGRFFTTLRIDNWAFRLSYQYAKYIFPYGSNHFISTRIAYRFTPSFKLSLSVAVQADWFEQVLRNRALLLNLGALFTF